MKEDTIQDIIRDAHALAQWTGDADLIQSGAETIARRLERLVALDAVAANPPLRVPVISMPGRAALAYRGGDSGLPRLNAAIETCKNVKDGKEYQECVIYIGQEVLADMKIFRGKGYAIKMVRGALKGAMSRLGKHRRMTANKALRRAKKEVA